MCEVISYITSPSTCRALKETGCSYIILKTLWSYYTRGHYVRIYLIRLLSLRMLKHKKIFNSKWSYIFYFCVVHDSYSEASGQGTACQEHSKSSYATDGMFSKLQLSWPNSTAATTTDCSARTETGWHSKQFWGRRACKELFGFGALRMVEQSGILNDPRLQF